MNDTEKCLFSRMYKGSLRKMQETPSQKIDLRRRFIPLRIKYAKRGGRTNPPPNNKKEGVSVH